MELALIRSYFPNGTNGMLYYNNSFQCFTIELPWLNNQHSISCIPEGKYRLSLRYTRQRGLHLALDDVRNRSLVLIHPANDALKELQGCIAPVTSLTGQGKGNLSGKACSNLLQLVKGLMEKDPVYLTIKSKTDEHNTKDAIAHSEVF